MTARSRLTLAWLLLAGSIPRPRHDPVPDGVQAVEAAMGEGPTA